MAVSSLAHFVSLPELASCFEHALLVLTANAASKAEFVGAEPQVRGLIWVTVVLRCCQSLLALQLCSVWTHGPARSNCVVYGHTGPHALLPCPLVLYGACVAAAAHPARDRGSLAGPRARVVRACTCVAVYMCMHVTPASHHRPKVRMGPLAKSASPLNRVGALAATLLLGAPMQ